MTKSVRIENADTSNYKVRVFIEDKDADGNWSRTPDAQPAASLDFPTAMATVGITSHRRAVVEEAA